MSRSGSPARILAGVWLVALAACGGGEGAGTGPARTAPDPAGPRHNLVIVTIDTLRRDHLGCYGYFRETSPNLDAFARGALVFEDFQTNAAQTLPSHTSLFTGLSPREHGIESNISYMGGSYVPAESVQLLAEVLRRQGYSTAAFVSASPLKAGAGLEVGFQTWVEPDKDVKNVRGSVTLDAALAWFDEAPEEPWFLWFHIFDPHHPYTAPLDFRRFGPTDEQLTYFEERGIPTELSKRPPRVIDVRAMHDDYDNEVLFSDHVVGGLLKRIAEEGAWEETAVVITSDHGEGLWQHGERDHSSIWNEQLAVPLLIRVPGVGGRRIQARMVGSDLLPTLFGLLPGLDDGGLVAQSSGVDVLAPDFDAPPRYTIVPPMPLRRQLTERPPLYVHALEHAGWRVLVREDDHVELYHVAEDPHELVDLAEVEPGRTERMLGLLERRLAREMARREELGAGGLGPMDPERLRALEALGYGGGQK